VMSGLIPAHHSLLITGVAMPRISLTDEEREAMLQAIDLLPEPAQELLADEFDADPMLVPIWKPYLLGQTKPQ
jgi:hypothetical protein